MKRFAVTTRISAPPAKVWDLLVDLARWPEWNTTVERVEGTCALGQTVKLYVKLNPGRAFPVKVQVMEAPRRMVWGGGMPLGLFKGERVYTLTPLPGDGCEFSMVETFTGPMAPLIGKSIPDMQPAFDEFAACLKAKAEG